MPTTSFRTTIVRILFFVAILTFSTGLMKFFGINSLPLSYIHHFSGILLTSAALCHMAINRRALIFAFRGTKKVEKTEGS